MSTDINSPTGAVAESYARAIFELAKEADQADAVLSELRELADLATTQPQLHAIFVHQTIDPARRKQTMQRLFSGRISDLTLRFLLVLNDKGRFDQLPAVTRAFDRMLKASRGQVDVQVITARPLDASGLAAVGDRISSAIGKKAVVHPQVDPSLIGGLKVRIGDRLIDASVATRLRKMSRKLVEGGHENLRRRVGSLLS